MSDELLTPETFLGLDATEDPATWRCEVTPGISTGGGFIYGGCGLALGLVPLERLTHRPPVWVAAQFLSYAGPGEDLTIDATEAVRGHQLSQARAVIRTDDREVLRVQASLGLRPFEGRGRWVQPPAVPGPEECPPADRWFAVPGTVATRIETREAPMARPATETGRTAFWGRVPELEDQTSSLALALHADSMMMGVSRALDRMLGGNSLDNTLRTVEHDDSDWVLVEHRAESVHEGFASATSYLWSQDGALLCIASQTARLRVITPEMLEMRGA